MRDLVTVSVATFECELIELALEGYSADLRATWAADVERLTYTLPPGIRQVFEDNIKTVNRLQQHFEKQRNAAIARGPM